jgi:adhesin transport system outer membrane protein
VAEANLTVSKALLAEAQQAIMLEATASFFEIQRVSERLVAAKANELEHKRLLETIQRRVKSEISPVTDATQAQARLQQAVAERLQFERQLETLRIGLEQIVGKLQGPLRPPSKIPMDQWSTDALLEAAKSYSPEMQRREAQIQAAGAQIITAKAAIMPQLSLQQEFKMGSIPAGTDRSRTYLSLSVQTGAGLSTLSAIDVVAARQQAARDGLEQNVRLLEQTVRTTWNDVNALTMQLKPSQDLLEASDEVVSSYLRQFQVGRKMWLDVLNAQREKTNARYALTDIETPLLFSKIRLLLLVGAVRPGSMGAIYE